MIGSALLKQIIDEYVLDKQVIGIGTDPSTETLIGEIAKKARKEKIKVKIVPSSMHAAETLADKNLEITSVDVEEIDLAIEFVSQIDKYLNFLKHESYSLVRDRMVIESAETLIVLAEQKDYVEELSKPIPLEVVPFGYHRTLIQLKQYGDALIRKKNGRFYKTETGNYLVDLNPDQVFTHDDIDDLRRLPGVIEVGLFRGLADEIILYNGKLKHFSAMKRPK